VIVWGGGVDGQFLNTGARYLPATDTWRTTSLSNAPSPRWFHAAVWTGREMIIWSGRPNFFANDNLNDGARYNPVTDTWTPISNEGAPTRRSQCGAVWTGSEMIVWGGETEGGVPLADGARYDPATDTWRPISDSGLEPRMEPTAIWTGSEMIVFGGVDATRPGWLSYGNGARYNPTTDTWNALAVQGAPRSRTGHTAVWTGERMIVWGGRVLPQYDFLNDGATYSPGSDTWTPASLTGAPQARMLHAAVWTGTEMIVWGGQASQDTLLLNTGARYNPATGVWTPTTQENAPRKRQFWRPDLGIWTGSGMLVCAGSDYPTSLDSTHVYRPIGTNAPPPPTNCVATPPGVVAWWRAEENANDEGANHSATANNGVSYQPGLVGKAFRVDGAHGRINVPDDESFKLVEALSIEGWVKLANPAFGLVLMRGDDRPGLDPYFLGVNPGVISFGISDNVDSAVVSAPFPTGEWKHVAGTFEASTGLLKLYLDGALVTQMHTTRRPARELDDQSNPGLGIGNVSGSSINFPWDGWIDEVTLYNRALSDGEILSIYHAGSAGKCVTNAPPPRRTFDLSRDYSLGTNPNGPWSYGYLTELNGTFGLARAARTFASDNGVPIAAWELDTYQIPGVWKVLGPGVAHSDGDNFTAEAGTVYFAPGADGAPHNFGAIRFTVPAGGGGQYRIETSVRSLFDYERSRDADFHVLKNGQEVFGQFLSPNSGTSYSNVITLAAGDAIDFAIGRGADGLTADTGLKIQATLILLADLPPPPPPVDFYDVSRDFSPTHNPNGAWSYGYQTRLGGTFTLLGFPLTSFGDNPVPVDSWSKNGYEPVAVYHNGTTHTSVSDGGAGVFPPGTTWFYPGVEGHIDNYGVIRFTVPAGGAGIYQLQTEVRAYLDGPRSGDTDFHVLKNGVELFGEFIAGNSGTGYSNRLNLAGGDRIDFAVGRGRDNIAFDSGLKIRATIGLVSTPPPPPPPEPTYDLSRDFSRTDNPNGPWSYGYLTELNASFGLVSAARMFASDNGVPIAAWELHTYQIPGVWKVLGPEIAHSDGDHFTAEPGTVYFAPGADGAPQNFGAIRFTVPAGGDGQYRIETLVRSLFDHARSRDADFHVLRNGHEIFSRFLPPNSGASYSNSMTLGAGDTIDFAIGRGADGTTFDTGLKIQAMLTLLHGTTNPPPPPGTNCVPASAGLVAWWPAERNANDIAGTNRGVLFGGASYATGKVGRAFSFPGNASGVKIPATPSLNVGRGAGLTIEGWINPADLSIRGPLVEWNRGDRTSSSGARISTFFVPMNLVWVPETLSRILPSPMANRTC
jgi:hypothetical protein